MSVMDVDGGRRDRAVMDSFREHVILILETRGWLDVNRKHPPLEFIQDFVEADLSLNVKENTFVCFSHDNTESTQLEVGSNSVFSTHYFWIDVFADTSAGSAGLGREIAGDIQDGLRGLLPSAGFDEPGFRVYDLRDKDNPVQLFWVDVAYVNVEQARRKTRTENSWHQMLVGVEEART